MIKTNCKTRVLSIVLAMSLVLSSGLCCVQAASQAPETTVIKTAGLQAAESKATGNTYNGYEVITNTYRCPDVSNNVDYYYSDGYFAQSASVANQHLTTTSINMAVAAFGYSSNTYSPSYRITNMFKNMGFAADNIYTNEDEWVTPTENTIGIATSYKHVQNDSDDYYIVPVALRGGNYYSEWIGNAVFGETGNGENYQAAADKTYNYVKTNVLDKLENLGVSKDNIKIWITGYSRGGAVANLTAKALTDNYGADNVYAYCFEAPKCAVDYTSASYSNIRNYAYDADIINYIAPAQFGFGLYGQTETISTSTYDASAKDAQRKIIDPSYEVDTEGFKEATIKVELTISGIRNLDLNPKPTGNTTSQAEFNALLVKDLVEDWGIIPSRSYYVNTVVEYGTNIQEVLKLIFDLVNNTDTDYLTDGFEASIKNFGISDYWNIFSMVKSGADSVDWSKRKSIYDKMWTGFVNGGGTTDMTEDQKTRTKTSWYTVCRVVVDILHYDAADMDAVMLGTLVYNLDRVTDAHYPETPLAFLRTKDSYYVACTHSLQKTEAVAATCDAAGHTAYWTCTSCGQMYTDEQCTKEIGTVAECEIPQIDANRIVLADSVYVYDGSEKTPSVSVKDVNGKALVKGTDYDVTYSNNKELSTETSPAKATITFKGNYAGSVDKEFQILEGKTVSGKITGYAGINDLTVTLKQGAQVIDTKTASKGTDSYSYKFTDVEPGEYTLTVSAQAAADVDYIDHSYSITVDKAVLQNTTIHLLGDANMDGKRSAEDITKLARHTAKISLIEDAYNVLLLDTDRQGNVGDAADITHLARFVAKIIDAL